jgi:hypothetical protein
MAALSFHTFLDKAKEEKAPAAHAAERREHQEVCPRGRPSPLRTISRDREAPYSPLPTSPPATRRAAGYGLL